MFPVTARAHPEYVDGHTPVRLAGEQFNGSEPTTKGISRCVVVAVMPGWRHHRSGGIWHDRLLTMSSRPVDRRRFITGFLIAGPTLAVAARIGLADGAGAFPTRTDEVPDAQDLTDILILTQQPTIYDLKIEIRPDGWAYAEIPKAEVGQ